MRGPVSSVPVEFTTLALQVHTPAYSDCLNS
jgi:hypothetical protein